MIALDPKKTIKVYLPLDLKAPVDTRPVVDGVTLEPLAEVPVDGAKGFEVRFLTAAQSLALIALTSKSDLLWVDYVKGMIELLRPVLVSPSVDTLSDTLSVSEMTDLADAILRQTRLGYAELKKSKSQRA